MIFVECDNDEALLRGLGFPRKAFEHIPSKGRIAIRLQKAKSGTIGLVDQDPGAQPNPYLARFSNVDSRPDLGLRRLHLPEEGKWIIEIQPDLEPWLYGAGKAAGIEPVRHFLPSDFKGLHRNPKPFAARLIDFVAAIHATGSKPMQVLQEWLSGQ